VVKAHHVAGSGNSSYVAQARSRQGGRRDVDIQNNRKQKRARAVPLQRQQPLSHKLFLTIAAAAVGVDYAAAAMERLAAPPAPRAIGPDRTPRFNTRPNDDSRGGAGPEPDPDTGSPDVDVNFDTLRTAPPEDAPSGTAHGSGRFPTAATGQAYADAEAFFNELGGQRFARSADDQAEAQQAANERQTLSGCGPEEMALLPQAIASHSPPREVGDPILKNANLDPTALYERISRWGIDVQGEPDYEDVELGSIYCAPVFSPLQYIEYQPGVRELLADLPPCDTAYRAATNANIAVSTEEASKAVMKRLSEMGVDEHANSTFARIHVHKTTAQYHYEGPLKQMVRHEQKESDHGLLGLIIEIMHGPRPIRLGYFPNNCNLLVHIPENVTTHAQVDEWLGQHRHDIFENDYGPPTSSPTLTVKYSLKHSPDYRPLNATVFHASHTIFREALEDVAERAYDESELDTVFHSIVGFFVPYYDAIRAFKRGKYALAIQEGVIDTAVIGAGVIVKRLAKTWVRWQKTRYFNNLKKQKQIDQELADQALRRANDARDVPRFADRGNIDVAVVQEDYASVDANVRLPPKPKRKPKPKPETERDPQAQAEPEEPAGRLRANRPSTKKEDELPKGRDRYRDGKHLTSAQIAKRGEPQQVRVLENVDVLSRTPEDIAEIDKLKALLTDAPSVNAYINNPSGNCFNSVNPVIMALVNSKQYDRNDIGVRAAFFWNRASGRIPSNHFTVTYKKADKKYIIDVTAAQFTEYHISDFVIDTEENWEKLFQRHARMTVIKFKDFRGLLAAQNEFGNFAALPVTKPIRNGWVLTRPPWYRRRMFASIQKKRMFVTRGGGGMYR